MVEMLSLVFERPTAEPPGKTPSSLTSPQQAAVDDQLEPPEHRPQARGPSRPRDKGADERPGKDEGTQPGEGAGLTAGSSDSVEDPDDPNAQSRIHPAFNAFVGNAPAVEALSLQLDYGFTSDTGDWLSRAKKHWQNGVGKKTCGRARCTCALPE